jgi:hypothetical protein
MCWGAGGRSADRDLQAGEETAHAITDLVADGTNLGDGPARRVVELPVLVTLAGKDRTGITASHRDDHVGRAEDLVGPRLRELARGADPEVGTYLALHCMIQ